MLILSVPPNLALYEVVVAPGYSGAATGFALAVVGQILAGKKREDAQVLWARQDQVISEAGTLYRLGLPEFDIDPSRLILVHLRTPLHVLRAGLEAARCSALSVVIIEMIAPIDFTASRRLKLAAQKSGTRVVLIQHADVRGPTAASLRWRVSGAVSQDGDRPAFDITTLKHPNNFSLERDIVEWDREQRTFVKTLSQPMDALSHSRQLAA